VEKEMYCSPNLSNTNIIIIIYCDKMKIIIINNNVPVFYHAENGCLKIKSLVLA